MLAVLVFVPIRYVYPSRTPRLAGADERAGVVWGVLMLVMLWQYPAMSRRSFSISLVFPVYYMLLSLALQFRRARHSRSA